MATHGKGGKPPPGTRPLVALLTDYGLDAWYVSAMKGVIKSICPRAEIIDISHGVSPHSVAEGALILFAAQKYFPEGTVFVAVVDPGVGTAREPIVVLADGKWFIAPNNGLLGLVTQHAARWECRRLSNSAYFLPDVSSTFHGRDIFAPAAAHLAAGVPWTRIAPSRTECFRLVAAAASYDRGIIEGNIIYFDRFGNAVTNISRILFNENIELPHVDQGKKGRRADSPTAAIAIYMGNFVLPKINTTFADVKVGEPLAFWGSMGTLEIGVNLGNAKALLGLKLLDKVTVKRVGKHAA